MPRANTNSRLAYNKTYQRARKASLRAKGMCLDCGKAKAVPSSRRPGQPGVRCAACAAIARKKSQEFMARRRSAWVKLGFCVTCGVNLSMKATTPGCTDTRCAACADYQDQRRSENRDKANAYRRKLNAESNC